MKITYIATSVIPSHKANALQVMKTCGALKKQGADIELIIPVRFGGVRLKENPFEFYKINNHFRITKIFSLDLMPIKILGALSYWIQNLSFAIFCTLYLLFKKSDFYYSRSAVSGFFLGFFKKNIIYELHRLPNSRFNRFIFKRLLKKICGLVVIAEELKRMVVEQYNFDSQKIAVAHDAVDLGQFNTDISQKEAREKLGLPQDKKIICYTGSLQYVKGVDILIKAMDFLPEIYCYIIGPRASVVKGDKRSYETKNKRIIFLGQKPHNLIPIFLKAADVLVIPHRDISFSFSPLKLFEYMAAKRPIVSSKVKALINILGESGAVYFKAEDGQDLAKKIKLALTDTGLSEKIVDNAFAEVQNYTWQQRANKILNFLNICAG